MTTAASDSPALRWALRRDRWIVLGALGVVAAASWAYVLAGAGMEMGPPPGAGMQIGAMAPAWTPGYALLMLAMWWVMMVAMMLPSAAPTVLLFAALNRTTGERGHPVVPTGLFAAGYLIAWGGFSLAAAALQWGLEQWKLVNPMMASASVPFGAALLIGAGVYQLTPLKDACLRHCRAPLDFLGRRWRKGAGGAVRMGLEHGLYCLGCCWVLMALLFYGGVMNLTWIGGLALYVLVEKLAPASHWIGRLTGAALIVWGAVVLARHLGGG